MVENKTYNKLFYIFFALLGSLLFFVISKDNFFYWDNISQISIPANWIYENSFNKFWVPDDHTTGHLPILPYYIAGWWKLFNRTILISHVALLPFIFGFLYQIQKLTAQLFPKKGIYQYTAIFIILLDATLLAQFTLITPDIILSFLFVWALNALIANKNISFIIAMALLGLINMRGLVTLSGLSLFYLWFLFILERKKPDIKSLSPLIIPFITIFVVYGWHYLEKGWLFHNAFGGKWDNASKWAEYPHLIKNIAAFVFQQIDYGRILLWSVNIFFIITIIKNRRKLNRNMTILYGLLLSQLIVWFAATIPFQNFFGHRYFMPVFMLLGLLTAYIITNHLKFKQTVFSACFLCLMSGYFWVYPRKIAQGWDATPAHWPYYQARLAMIDYINKKQYKKNEISSFFPNLADTKNIDLKTEKSFRFKEFKPDTDTLVFYSNTYNVEDSVIDALFYSGQWIEEHKIKNMQVEVILLRKKDTFQKQR